MTPTLPVLLLSSACLAWSPAFVGAFRTGPSPVGALAGRRARRGTHIHRAVATATTTRRRRTRLESGMAEEPLATGDADRGTADTKDTESPIHVGKFDEETNEARDETRRATRLIKCSSCILLPFSAEVAFDAFSDLTRQPSWCKYLYSVEYVDDGVDEALPTDGNMPLRQSKWTVGVKGFRFSWRSNDTYIERPRRMEWESTSGLKNRGSVEFEPQSPAPSAEVATRMTIHFTFVAPRVVSGLLRRSGKIRKYTEEVLLTNMLTNFRDVVAKER